MEERDPLIGRQLGAYQIQGKLGEGGMARVYKAYHARLRRDVAIKVILAPSTENSDFRVRFEREAQLAASLEHPNIVAVYDFSEEGQLAYLVMQYVGGGTLRDHLREGEALAPQQAAHYALLMARALHHAHQRGIVHRDVKPQNMLVSAHNRNQLLLSDFGIAKLFDSSQEFTHLDISANNVGTMRNESGLTQADQIIGTLEYMAPEQIRRKTIDARSDVYALGVVLFQMLTGRVPFLSTTATGLLYQHVYMPAPSVLELNPGVPEPLARITARALQKAPAARFQSAEAMAQILESVLNATNSRSSLSAVKEQASLNQAATLPTAPVYEQRTAASAYAAIQPTEITSVNGPPERTTGVGRIHSAFPLQPIIREKKPVSIPMIVGIVLVVIALAALVMRFQSLPGVSTAVQQSSNTSVASGPFVDTFTDNHLAWIEGDTGGLTASVSNSHYSLTTTGTQSNTYFPYPTREGPAPRNFTLTTRITQDTGSSGLFYGLAFYLNYQNNAAKSCYAFVINSNGDYMILRYDTGGTGSTQFFRLWQGRSSAIHSMHQSNELQAIVQDGTFSFKINGQIQQLKAGNSLTDKTYTSGQIGLMVTGPGTSFSVTQVQLA